MKKIINTILHRFKEDSLTKRSGLVDRNVGYKGLKEIKDCLVFWQADPESEQWIAELNRQMPGVRLDKLCFVPTGVEFLETDDMVTFRNEELGFGGKIQNERLHTVLSRNHDLLLDLTPISNAMIQYVLTTSQACCIAGMKKEGGVADIIVDGVKQPVEFIKELTKILAEINKY